MAVPRIEAGTTRQFTWVASAAPSTISMALFNSSGSLVSSATATSSSATSFFRFVTLPASADAFSGTFPARYLAEWRAVVDGNLYITRDELEIVDTRATPF